MPSVLVTTQSQEVLRRVQAICEPSGWGVVEYTGTHAEAPAAADAALTVRDVARKADAALFDMQGAPEMCAALVEQVAAAAPFLPLVFLSREGVPPHELGSGLRYHINPEQIEDLEHILISLTCGFGAEGPERSTESEPNAIPRVLVVDDSILFASVVTRALRALERFDVETAHSGYEAVAILSRFHPDIVIIDIVLGDVDGREVCAFIRNHEHLKHTKVLGLSGYVFEDLVAAGEAHFDAFLEKPCHVKDILDTVLRLLS